MTSESPGRLGGFEYRRHPVQVPELEGMTESQARTALVQAGLTFGTATEEDDSTEPAGTIIGQSPSAGSMVDPESAVNVTISSGMMTVPNLRGLDQSTAQRQLSDRNLRFNVTYQESAESEQGTVISQGPSSGLVEQGSIIELVVAQAVQETPEPTTEEPTPDPTEEPTDPAPDPTEVPTDPGNGG